MKSNSKYFSTMENAKLLYNRRKYYWCPQNAKWLIDYSAIKLFSFQYCDSNIRLFSNAPCKVIALNLFNLLFGIINSFSMALRAETSNNYCCHYSWKSDNYIGSNTEKKLWSNLIYLYTKWIKGIKSDNLCYCKVG